MNFIKSYLKKVRYLVEAAIVWLFIDFFRLLKVDAASNIAAAISKFVGKKISVHKLAYRNLSKALPDLSEKEKEKILDEMWDNLGRICGEFAFVSKIPVERLDDFVSYSKDTEKNILELKNSGKGGIIFSGHIGNWELGPKFLVKYGINVSTVYRPLNNPYVEEMTASMRKTDMIGKNSAGNRKIIDVVKKGGFVIILADQKVSEGEPVKFFHDNAITTTSIARIALKYDVPVIPARVIRLENKFKFCVELEKPLVIEKTNDVNLDAISVTRQINQKLENWIKEFPSQWFWVHNRWKK
jgi:KDO2-lipid IV(A) lauroyltransferase